MERIFRFEIVTNSEYIGIFINVSRHFKFGDKIKNELKVPKIFSEEFGFFKYANSKCFFTEFGFKEFKDDVYELLKYHLEKNEEIVLIVDNKFDKNEAELYRDENQLVLNTASYSSSSSCDEFVIIKNLNDLEKIKKYYK